MGYNLLDIVMKDQYFYLTIALLGIVAIILVLFAVILFFKQKESKKETLETVAERDRKISSLEYELESKREENRKLTAMIADGERGDHEEGAREGKVLFNKREIPFADSFEKLPDIDKKLYEQVVEYGLSLDKTQLNKSMYHERICYGKAKPIAEINIRRNKVVVTTNLGKMKLDEEGITPIELKPIKLVLKDEGSLEQAKKNIDDSYLRTSGQLSLELNDDLGLAE